MNTNNKEAIDRNLRIETRTDSYCRVYTLVPIARSNNYIVVVAGDTTGIYELLQDNEDAEVQETPRCGDINCNSTHCVKPSSKVEKLKELQRRFSTNLDYGAQWADLVKILNVLIEDEE